MAGAYGFRCLCLLFASIIIQYRWLTLLGAAYLIYLMCKELTTEKEKDDGPDEESDGPELDVTTTVRDAVPVLAGSERPVRAIQDGRVVGVVDRVAVLKAIAGEGG